jgi:cyclic peptide transporter
VGRAGLPFAAGRAGSVGGYAERTIANCMELIRFVSRESVKALQVIVLMSCVAGISNSALVALINAGAAAANKSTTATRDFFLFLVALGLLAYTSVNAATRGRTLMESAVSKLRLRIFDKIRRSELATVESLRQNEVIAKTSKNVGQVLNATDVLVASSQTGLMIFVCSLYLAWLSFAAFCVVMLGILALGYVRYLRDKTQRRRFEGLINQEARQATFISHLMEGFKETKTNAAKSQALFDAYGHVIDDARQLGLQTGRRNIISGFYLQIGVYLILLFTVFIMPRYFSTFGEQIMQITAVVLFLVGTFLAMVQTIPIFSQTNAALRDIERLERQLDQGVEPTPPPDPALRAALGAFRTLEVRSVLFSYPPQADEPGFSVGPIDLTISRGELLFIAGGNGSGKSTFLKLLTGLYQPDAGRLLLDGQVVLKDQLYYYRDLFSVIFNDFHLFDRFYGCESVDDEKVASLIRLMKLEEKVQFHDGRFSTLNLSTGQRKRLALIAALVEDKEICIFDEWAADQDHHFREFFYKVILADLKQTGRTVIAVTHDESFWDIADRVIKFEYGKLAPLAPVAPRTRRARTRKRGDAPEGG